MLFLNDKVEQGDVAIKCYSRENGKILFWIPSQAENDRIVICHSLGKRESSKILYGFPVKLRMTE